MTESEYDLTRKSRPIVIVPYQERWQDEFRQLGMRLRSILSTSALRIDPIGSTSVPGLGAKDIIDIQITVTDLDRMDAFQDRMRAHGFQQRDGFRYDNFCGPVTADPLEWRKRYFREPDGERRVHIHVREQGRRNQRYALLFRDFLRSNATVRTAYEVVKRRLANIFPECIDGYLYIKDPLMDIIYEAALIWAKESDWDFDEDHL